MMVDLRLPLDVHADLQTRMEAVDSAIGAAENDAVQRVPRGQTVTYAAIGPNRWTDTDVSLSCREVGLTVQGSSFSVTTLKGFSSSSQASSSLLHTTREVRG
jgi:hypothetical protein